MFFEQPKISFVQRAVIHRIFESVVVAIFSLPLYGSSTTLIDTPRWRLRDHPEERRIKTGRFNVWINLNLKLWQQGYAWRQNGYGQHFRRDIARQISDAHVVEQRFISPRTPAPRNTARHWMNRAFGLVIWEPLTSVYGVLQSLQVVSGRSLFPVRVCNSIGPVPRHQIRPHDATNLASRTGDS